MIEIIKDFLRTPLGVNKQCWYWIMSSFLFCQMSYRFIDWYYKKWRKNHPYNVLTKIEQAEWQARIASTLHSSIVFPVSLAIIIFDTEFRSNPVFGKNFYSIFCFNIGIGDFVWIIKYNIPPLIPIICHHLFAGWGFLVCVSDQGVCLWYATALLITEGSTPWNNIHWMIEKSNLKETKLYKYIGLIFTLNWLLFRILINPYILYYVYQYWNEMKLISTYCKILLFLNMGFLMLLNNYWFIAGPFYEIVFGKKIVNQEKNKKLTGDNKKKL